MKFLSIAVAPAFAVLLITAGAQERPKKIDEMTDTQQKAIEKGFNWLVKTQGRDGLWGCEKASSPSTAITALAVLALCASGSTPAEGPYARNIHLGIERLLAVQAASGQISRGVDVTSMGLFYDHSCATLCLAEVLGMTRDIEQERVRSGLEKAVGFLYKTQGPDGGWDPQGSGGPGDIAITCNVWMALRAAHNAGITIENASVEKVESFVTKCALPRGGFSQYVNERGQGRMFYPTAAGLRILMGMGKNDLKEVEDGSEILIKKKLGEDYGGQISEWDYCAAFFAVQAMMHDGDSRNRYWSRWFPAFRDVIVKIQNADGSWSIQYCTQCRAYATALSLLVLQAPKRLLPIFQL